MGRNAIPVRRAIAAHGKHGNAGSLPSALTAVWCCNARFCSTYGGCACSCGHARSARQAAAIWRLWV